MKKIEISFKIEDGYTKNPYKFIVHATSSEAALKNFMKVFEEQLDWAETNGYVVHLIATEL
jgi:hypothetical protein